MKGLKKVFTLSFCFMIIILLVGCSKKKISTEKFRKTLEKDNFVVTDIVKSEKNGVLNFSQANDKDNKYQIEFYQFDNNENAKLAFHNLRLDLYSIAVKGSTSGSIERKNYLKFVLTNDDKYYSLSLIDNTLIFAYTSLDNKSELKNIVKKLGY